MKQFFIDLFRTKPVIEFYCHPDYEDRIPEPIPSKRAMPKWWKRLSDSLPHHRDAFGKNMLTAKKCMPLLDAMSYGYMLVTCGDVYVKSDENSVIIEQINAPGIDTAGHHIVDQIGGSGNVPFSPGNPIKFHNHWVIKTKPGWSCLFVPPVNHFDSPFSCLGGLVDTDKYPKEINFPALWTKPNWEGTIPAGTPLVQIIPIKRKTLNRNPKIRKMTDEEFRWIAKEGQRQESQAFRYTNILRDSDRYVPEE